MAKTLDYIALSIIVFLLTFVTATLAFDKWVVSLVFSVCLSAIIVFTVIYFTGKRGKPYDYDRLALELSVRGSEYLINLIKSTLKNNKIESGSNYILLDDAILIASFKFSILAISDMSAIYQLATAHKKNHIYVMARGIDRRAYQALLLQDMKLTVIKIKPIYRYLQKNNALPRLKRDRKKFSFTAIWETILKRSNTKNYIFSGVMMIAVAFLTPLKIYYLVFGAISLLLALLTLTPLGKGEFRSAKAFDKLEELNTANSLSNDTNSESNASDSGTKSDSNFSKTDENSNLKSSDNDSESKINKDTAGNNNNDNEPDTDEDKAGNNNNDNEPDTDEDTAGNNNNDNEPDTDEDKAGNNNNDNEPDTDEDKVPDNKKDV